MTTKTDELVRINRTVILRKSRPDDSRIVFSEDFDEETTIFRKLCLLPFEPIWYYFIIIIGLINAVVAMVNCMQMICGYEEYFVSNIFYITDLAWFMNISILFVCKYMRSLKTTQILFPKRSIMWFIVDYISIFPLELVMPIRLRAYASLTNILKISYIMFVFRFLNSRLDSQVFVRIFQLIYNLIFFITFVSLVFTVILHQFDTNPGRHSVIGILYIVTDHMTGRGFGSMAMEHYINKLWIITTTQALFVGVMLISTANVTFLFYSASVQKNAFRYNFNNLTNQLKRKNVPELIDCTNIVFDAAWTHAHGSEQSIGGSRLQPVSQDASILSPTFFAEITIDMCTGIFRHSMLLSKLPVPFLRDLSACVTYEVYVQQQLICKLDELKDKMIYIYKGVVEIISDEDGETPMMLLTAGTCLSEVCLFIPYKSNFLMRCATTCIFHILRREDFMRMTHKYPKEQKQLRTEICDRFRDGRLLKKIQSVVNTRADVRQKCTSMCWLLYVLHKMTANAHPHSAALHTLSNMRLAQMMSEDRFKNHIFSPRYLTLYSVPEERQDYNDTLFAKSTFPYVFKPDTGLTLFWEIVISALALTSGLVIPYYAFTQSKDSQKMIFIVVYFFTGVWLFDIVIQLRISIVYEKKVVSGFFDILIMKLTNAVFLFDMASVLPFEMFSGLFVRPSNYNYVYMNRILKLARVIRLLIRWEGRYNSNPLYVRFACVLIFMFYIVFIISCVFYYIDYRGDGGPQQFQILLFYTSQMLTGVAVWVTGYSDFPSYQAFNIVLYLAICAIYSVIYGMIFAAYTSLRIKVERIKHKTKELIRVAVAVDPRYEYYIQNVLHDSVTINNGFAVQSPRYMYHSLPQEFLGYLFETHYQQEIQRLPIFVAIPPLRLKQIFEEGAYTHLYNAHEVLFHVGDLLDDLLLLVNGTCEVICGVTLNASFVEAVHDLNGIEIRLVLPMRTTVITVTHCRILRIKYHVIRRVLLQHESRTSIRSQLAGWRDLRARIQHTPVQYFTPDLLDNHKKDISVQPHVFFGRTNPGYLEGYRQTGLYKMRWLFMNLSFCPGGRFIEIWEIGRCVCAVLSALFFTCITSCFYVVPHPLGVCKWALEVMALIDIYIRMHVAYYNEYGVLVTHPGYTIINYCKRGFLVDLIAALPLHLAIKRAEYVVLNLNKILQLHRYIAFVNYKRENRVMPLSNIYMLEHIPLMLVAINVMATIMLLYNCAIDMSSIGDASITCARDSIFDYKDHPLTDPNVAHIHAIYIVLSIISKIAVQGFTVSGAGNRVFIVFMSFIGYCLEMINAARIFGFFINEYMGTMHRYVRMRLLLTFISPRKKTAYRTSNELIRLSKNHVRLTWSMSRNDVFKHSKDFPHNLRRDIIYKKFGPSLILSFLSGAEGTQGLIRNLLIRSDYRIYKKNSFIQMENDICEYTIIIFSGLVYIEAGSKPSSENQEEKECASLAPGSIIGNLCPLQYNRLKVNMYAMGVVELLFIKTNTFFETLQHFPSCQEKFRELRVVHITHVPGLSNFKYPQSSSKIRKHTIIIKHSKFAFLLLALLNFVGAYLSQIVFFKDILTVNIQNQIPELAGDGCYLIAIIMVFFLPLTNEKGYRMSKTEIMTNFYKRWLFYVCLVGAIPIYIIILLLNLEPMLTFYIYVAARSNVLLRNVFFFKVTKMLIQRAPSRMFILTFIQNIMIIILFIMGTTALLVIISDAQMPNMRPTISLKALLYATNEIKYRNMVTYLYVVSNMFTHTSQPKYSPAGLMHIVLFIVMMSMVMVINTMMYSIVVSMLQAIEQFKLSYLEQKKKIETLMRRSDTSSILDDRLNFYCKMTWRKRKGYKIPKLFLDLPSHLREAMLEDLFGGILENHEFFGQIHYDLRRQLYNKLHLDYFYHGDYIAYKGTVDETMYFVFKGIVVSLDEDNNSPPLPFEPGESFALLQGVMENLPHDMTYRAVCDSVILSLVRKDWDYMLHFYPASRNIISMVAANILALYKQHND